MAFKLRRARAVADSLSPITHELLTGRRAPIHAYLFELAAGLGYAAVGVANLINPAAIIASPVGRLVHPYDVIWSVIYVLAGTGVAAGVLKPSLRLRAVALIFLGAALTMQVIATLSYRPDTRIAFNVLMALACVFRATAIVRLTTRLQQGASPDAASQSA